MTSPGDRKFLIVLRKTAAAALPGRLVIACVSRRAAWPGPEDSASGRGLRVVVRV